MIKLMSHHRHCMNPAADRRREMPRKLPVVTAGEHH
jgi:hypothetical protein